MRLAAISLSVFLALAAVFQSDEANATPAGTGSFTLTVDITTAPPFPFTGSATWNNEVRDVFGRTVNLGTSVGTMTFSGTVNPGMGLPPAGDYSGTADGSPALTFTMANGDFICPDGTLDNCDPNPAVDPFAVSFVSDAISLAGTLVGPGGTQLPPDSTTIAYTQDGAHSCLTNGSFTAIDCTGTLALNAFSSEPTPTGTNVTSTVNTTFFNPITGVEVDVTVDVTFDNVSSAGETQVTTVSNAAGDISSNFAVQVGTFAAAFFDVTTTATISGNVTICGNYPDSSPDDGVVDGTEPVGGVPECDMALLHEESGVFVDRTLLASDPACPALTGTCPGATPPCVDTVNNVVCGQTAGLSVFVAAPGQLDDDADTVKDFDDNCTDVANLDQRNTNGDAFGNACDTDYDNNGVVGISDFNVLRGQFGQTLIDNPGTFDPDVDCDGDDVIGIPDFNCLRGDFGAPPGPAGL